MLFTGGRHRENAARVGQSWDVTPFIELGEQLLEGAHANRHIGKVAAVVIPHLSQMAGCRLKKLNKENIERKPPLLQAQNVVRGRAHVFIKNKAREPNCDLPASMKASRNAL